MTKTIVGIAANEVQESGALFSNQSVAYTPAGYVKGVQRAGGLPVIIPIGNQEDVALYVKQIDKLVLAGGQNVDPSFYGESLACDCGVNYRPRDEFELALIRETVAQGKPIFAVCRGAQLLNVAFGGSLHQELAPLGIEHMQQVKGSVPTHDIVTREHSLIRSLYGTHTKVNSFHRQGIDRIGAGLHATAWSPDGLVEGIENREAHLLGVQWHPDFAYRSLDQEQAAFNYVVDTL